MGERVSKPQVGAWYVNLDVAASDWRAASAAFSIAKRLELSYGYGFIDAQNVDSSINTHNLGANFKFLDETFGDTAWVPALAVGGIYKYTDTDVVDAIGCGAATAGATEQDG